MMHENESKTGSSASHSSDSSSSMNDASHYSATSSTSPYIHEIRDPNDPSIVLCYISRSYDHHHYTDVHQQQEQLNSEEYEHSRKLSKPNNTTFVTSDESVNPQIGFIVYPKNHHIKRHYHSTHVQRVVRGTPETLIIRQGAVTVHIYSILNNSHQTTSGICHQINGTACTVSSTVDASTNKTEQEQEQLQFQHVTSETLRSNDVCILVSGGHGFTIESENTVMLEIKQGPYAGVNDKVFF